MPSDPTPACPLCTTAMAWIGYPDDCWECPDCEYFAIPETTEDNRA